MNAKEYFVLILSMRRISNLVQFQSQSCIALWQISAYLPYIDVLFLEEKKKNHLINILDTLHHLLTLLLLVWSPQIITSLYASFFSGMQGSYHRSFMGQTLGQLDMYFEELSKFLERESEM